MFASMSLLHDQQLGGVLMKIIQEIVYGVILAHVFFEWYKKDQQEAKEEQLQLSAANDRLISIHLKNLS